MHQFRSIWAKQCKLD